MAKLLPFPDPSNFQNLAPYTDPLAPYVDRAALVPTPSVLPPLDRLRLSYLPISLAPIQYGSLQILPRNDPVLLHLAPVRSEATYRMMIRTEHQISTSMNALVRSLLGFGWGVSVAKHRRSSAGARLLRDQAAQAYRGIGNLLDVLDEAPVCILEGWRPAQFWWKPDAFRFRGRSQWGIDRVFLHEQDRYAFTPDRRLVWLGYGGSAPELLQPDGPESLGWSSLSCGSTVSPYGRALLQDLYLLWRIKQFLLEKFGRGVANAISGIPVFEEGNTVGSMPRIGAAAGDTGAAEMSRLLEQADEAMRILEERGFLLTRKGFSFKEHTTSGFASSYIEALGYLDKAIQLRIELQHLTASVGDSGSRAAADVQERTKMDAVRSMGARIQPLFQGIINRIIAVNTPDPDPEDIPEFKFRVLGLVNMESVAAFCALGGRVNAADVADDQGIPMADPDDPDEEVLTAPVPPPSPFAPGGAPAPGGQPPRPDGGEPQPGDGGPQRDRNRSRPPENDGAPGSPPSPAN